MGVCVAGMKVRSWRCGLSVLLSTLSCSARIHSTTLKKPSNVFSSRHFQCPVVSLVLQWSAGHLFLCTFAPDTTKLIIECESTPRGAEEIILDALVKGEGVRAVGWGPVGIQKQTFQSSTFSAEVALFTGNVQPTSFDDVAANCLCVLQI